MPTDDILWKKVDSLKSQEAEKPTPSRPASQRPPEEVAAFAKPQRKQTRSHTSVHDDGSVHNQLGEDASLQASMLARYPEEWIETIRKVVKETGREIAFARLTSQEKGRLTDVVYGFRRQGIRTSENEVLRIAINHLLEDFKACGNQSVLPRVIEALRA